MGYPNKRVSMTDVHGEPQQGGYLPAEIWHAYMSAVTEGKPCAPFPQPSESISYQPFYGKFATTGQSRVDAEAKPNAKNQRQEAEAGNAPRRHAAAAQAREPPARAAAARSAAPATAERPAPPAPARPAEPLGRRRAPRATGLRGRALVV